MTLSRAQKIGVVFFALSLPCAYLSANWRHEANLLEITEQFKLEQSLHLSTDKLLSNCERNAQKENTPYGANHQICDEGLQEHDLTARLMDALETEKERNNTRWYRNFFLSVLIFNLLGLAVQQWLNFTKRNDT
ncbi:hypothetical protein B9Z35_12630 [Limnohabitans sp. Jir61]|jgi:hypothetical protein|uniref:hypothetical protein n=1 Tax=Limnohabitans sp. Jir61 TaxID=1826168 RepID=UPI000D36C925|nr:hypothetical protein [Limnohabitans sp. Jir61]PUE28826.1 hypothetical protein B9Z35_12630 [Limnohabitans sp. Jir61]